jgi:hypothetical protein
MAMYKSLFIIETVLIGRKGLGYVLTKTTVFIGGSDRYFSDSWLITMDRSGWISKAVSLKPHLCLQSIAVEIILFPSESAIVIVFNLQ